MAVKRTWPEEATRRVLELRELGYSFGEIAAELGRTRMQVLSHFHNTINGEARRRQNRENYARRVARKARSPLDQSASLPERHYRSELF